MGNLEKILKGKQRQLFRLRENIKKLKNIQKKLLHVDKLFKQLTKNEIFI